MLLKEKYGAYDFEYWYLKPESVDECALIVKLSRLFPKMFELLIEKSSYSVNRRMILKVVCEEDEPQ